MEVLFKFIVVENQLLKSRWPWCNTDGILALFIFSFSFFLSFLFICFIYQGSIFILPFSSPLVQKMWESDSYAPFFLLMWKSNFLVHFFNFKKDTYFFKFPLLLLFPFFSFSSLISFQLLYNQVEALINWICYSSPFRFIVTYSEENNLRQWIIFWKFDVCFFLMLWRN